MHPPLKITINHPAPRSQLQRVTPGRPTMAAVQSSPQEFAHSPADQYPVWIRSRCRGSGRGQRRRGWRSPSSSDGTRRANSLGAVHQSESLVLILNFGHSSLQAQQLRSKTGHLGQESLKIPSRREASPAHAPCADSQKAIKPGP